MNNCVLLIYDGRTKKVFTFDKKPSHIEPEPVSYTILAIVLATHPSILVFLDPCITWYQVAIHLPLVA